MPGEGCDARRVEIFRAHGFSERQSKILALLIDARDNKAIAEELGIAVRTVKAHMNRMFMRHNLQGGIPRVKLAVMAYKLIKEAEQNGLC